MNTKEKLTADVSAARLALDSANKALLDFEDGAYRACNRKDVVRVTAWDDAAHMTAADLADYRTIVGVGGGKHS